MVCPQVFGGEIGHDGLPDAIVVDLDLLPFPGLARSDEVPDPQGFQDVLGFGPGGLGDHGQSDGTRRDGDDLEEPPSRRRAGGSPENEGHRPE